MSQEDIDKVIKVLYELALNAKGNGDSSLWDALCPELKDALRERLGYV